jgi:hypothetical protein
MKDPSTVDAQIPAEQSFETHYLRIVPSSRKGLTRMVHLPCDPSMQRGLRSGSDRVLGRVADQMRIQVTPLSPCVHKRGGIMSERKLWSS